MSVDVVLPVLDTFAREIEDHESIPFAVRPLRVIGPVQSVCSHSEGWDVHDAIAVHTDFRVGGRQ